MITHLSNYDLTIIQDKIREALEQIGKPDTAIIFFGFGLYDGTSIDYTSNVSRPLAIETIKHWLSKRDGAIQ